jgi:hypothetical protein
MHSWKMAEVLLFTCPLLFQKLSAFALSGCPLLPFQDVRFFAPDGRFVPGKKLFHQLSLAEKAVHERDF